MNRDKDREAFARALLEAAGHEAFACVVCFPLPGTRGATPQDLAHTAQALGIAAECALSPAEGLDRAAAHAMAMHGSVVATGSLYALTALRVRHAELFKG
jgi:folylpolyglutamate synthase/dihydropteroate synthase